MIQEPNGPLRLDSLSFNTLCTISSFLSIQDIRNFMQVCKSFNEFVNVDAFWRIYNKNSKSPCNFSTFANLTPKEVTQIHLLANTLHANPAQQIVLQGVWSSTNDNQQIIQETLNYEDNRVFWSSTGTHTPNERDETLVYIVPEGYGLISQISLKFFKAEYLENQWYPCRTVIVETGLSSDSLNYSEEFQIEIKDNIEDEEEFVVTFNLKQIQLCQVIKLTLRDKVYTQETDVLYYIAIQNMKMFGACIQNRTEKQSMAKNKICELIQKQKNITDLSFDNLARQQAAQFQASGHQMEMFNTLPELRVSKYVFALLEANQNQMKDYLNNYVINTQVLNEIESIIYIKSKIEFQQIVNSFQSSFDAIMNNNSHEKSAGDELVGKILTHFATSIIPFPFINSPYEANCLKFQYLTYSNEAMKQIVKGVLDYYILDEQFIKQTEEIAVNVFGNQSSFPISKQYFVHILRVQILPKAIFAIFTKLLKTKLEKPTLRN